MLIGLAAGFLMPVLVIQERYTTRKGAGFRLDMLGVHWGSVPRFWGYGLRLYLPYGGLRRGTPYPGS